MTLAVADRITLARLILAPLAAICYLLLPVDGTLCFWCCGWLCAFAEISDWLDGKVARARGEVSDFGKLADPFCDVLYRMSIFLVYLLPAGGIGYVVSAAGPGTGSAGALLGDGLTRYALLDPATLHGQPIHVTGWAGGAPTLGAGMVPWLPVFLMVLREIVAGALRAMTATKGLVLAARPSGKFKAWLQGITIITLMAFPAFWFQRAAWHLTYGYWATWVCCVVSLASILEYIWVNRAVLMQLAVRKPAGTG